jgi:DNA-binding NarL/FixJ family response regulator/transcriptional regulator with XRE-family HTH domain
MFIDGKRIRERRSEMGLSQQQLAGGQLSRSFISLVEQNKARPSRTTLELIAKRLGKPAEYFITDSQDSALEAILLLEKATQQYIAEKRWAEATQYAKTCLRMGEHTGRPDIELRLRKLLAISHLYSGQHDMALELFEQLVDDCKALDDKASLVEVYFRMGTLYQTLADYMNARRCYSNAARLSEDKKSLTEYHVSALINLGSCCCLRGQIDESKDFYLAAIRAMLIAEYPGLYADACLGLSNCLRLEGHMAEALAYANKAREVLEKSDPVAAVTARYSAASILAEADMGEAALADLHGCLQGFRDTGSTIGQAKVHCTLALCFLKRGEPDRVEAACEEALNLLDLRDDEMTRGIVYRRLAQAHRARGNTQRARDLFRMSLDLLRRIRAAAEADKTARLLEEPGPELPASAGQPTGLPTPLTGREIAVLQLLATGVGNRQIAEALILGEETVKTHVARIMQKLDATSRTHAVNRGREVGLLS